MTQHFQQYLPSFGDSARHSTGVSRADFDRTIFIQLFWCRQKLHSMLKVHAVGPKDMQCHNLAAGRRPKLLLALWTELDVDGTMLDLEATFCYLGDMLCYVGGRDNAIAARCCVALTQDTWQDACGLRSLGYAPDSVTWGPKEAELRQLCRNDRAMIHWICGIKDRGKPSPASLKQNIDIEVIAAVLRCRRLRWYGHVQWATSCI